MFFAGIPNVETSGVVEKDMFFRYFFGRFFFISQFLFVGHWVLKYL